MSVTHTGWTSANSLRSWGYYLMILAGIIAVGHLIVQSRFPPAVALATDLDVLLLIGISVAAVKIGRTLKVLEDRVHQLERR